MIRAVVHATDVPYKTVHRIMYGHGWRVTDGRQKGHWSDHIIRTLNDLGYDVEKISFPPRGGKRRANGHTVCKKYPTGTFIINQLTHIACIRDGQLLDTYDCRDDLVYFIWRVRRVPIVK